MHKNFINIHYLSIYLYTSIYLSISYNNEKNQEFISNLKRNEFEEEKVSKSSFREISI